MRERSLTDPNYVLESDETNNALAGNTITITRLYADLIMTSVTATPARYDRRYRDGDAIREEPGRMDASGFYVDLPVHGQHDHDSDTI